MNTFYQVLGLLGAGFIIWILYRSVRGNPAQFSKENLSKSFSTMAILALILIVFVSFLVFMVRQ